MPFGSVRLVPGINVEKTPTLLEAGYASSQLIRYRDGLAQKYGGWQAYFNSTVAGIPRELHAWEDLNGTTYLAVGTTTELSVITGGVRTVITPQTLTTNPAVSVTTTLGSQSLLITDANIGPWAGFAASTQCAITLTIDAIIVNTPISVGGLVFSGLYQSGGGIDSGGNHSFFITAEATATGSTTGGSVPVFTTFANSNTVRVALTNHGLSDGQKVTFNVSTTGNGVTISGSYTVNANSQLFPKTTTNFYITVAQTASASGSFSMNGGNAQFTYLLATGFFPGIEQTGTAISATDWTADNWGELLLACPKNGSVYQWAPGTTVYSASPVGTAPAFNGGIFVSASQQILICWASSGAPGLSQTVARNSGNAVGGGLGINQDSLTVAWSAVGDYTDFTPSSTNQAGSFRIPAGSEIRGGMSVQAKNLIWTDIDCWSMDYIGYPLVYAFHKIGAGAGLISSHAAMALRGNVYWMGPNNFYMLSGDGIHVIPCPIWDVVFQNLNTSFTANIRAMPNTPFNEVGWLYPSSASVSGECDSYVKFNITEQGQPWDYGTLSRSCWIDQSVLGMPISGDSSGNIYLQETTNDAAGSSLTASFTTGYFYLAEGEEYVFVDQVIPDMKWGTYGGAQTASVTLTFNLINYPGDTPTTYGPYTMTSTTQYISTRMRGRQMSVTVQSSDVGTWWRIGKIRYRYSADGRR